jgi:hypothetical protein
MYLGLGWDFVELCPNFFSGRNGDSCIGHQLDVVDEDEQRGRHDDGEDVGADNDALINKLFPRVNVMIVISDNLTNFVEKNGVFLAKLFSAWIII